VQLAKCERLFPRDGGRTAAATSKRKLRGIRGKHRVESSDTLLHWKIDGWRVGWVAKDSVSSKSDHRRAAMKKLGTLRLDGSAAACCREKRALRSLLLVRYQHQQAATNNGNAISDYFRGADYRFRARLSAQRSEAGSAEIKIET